VVQEYEAEGVALDEIVYSDNVDVLNLIEGRMGAVSILNEECVRPKGSDTSFVSKLYTMNTTACLIVNKRFRDYEFSINHFAGPVIYDANDFVRKNADTMPVDLVELARACQANPLIPTLFPLDAVVEQTSGGGRRGSTSMINQTVWTKFKSQLSSLMSELSRTNTRYIRCIKPNKLKVPHMMDHESAIDQLRCAGVVAAVTISRAAFPNRLTKLSLVDRFACLAPLFSGDAEALLSELLPAESYEVGKTKVYFRANQLEKLEQQRLEAMSTFATKIAAFSRMWILTRLYNRMRVSSILIQSVARSTIQCGKFENLKTASLLVQCFVRCRFAARLVLERRRAAAATILQAMGRRTKARKTFQVKRDASTRICAVVRGRVQKRRYKIELKEAIEERKLENQLKTLQRKLEEAELKQKEAEEKLSKRAASPVKEKMREQKSDDNSGEEEGAEDGFVDVAESQHELMDESGRMLEYLRKEVFKLRTANVVQRTENERLKENNRRLSDANAAAGASFAALNQHTKQLSKANMKYVADITNYKQHISRMQTQMSELKEELKMKQATYIAEVHTRIQFAKMLQLVSRTVEERVEDEEVVAEVNAMVEDCLSYDDERSGMDIDVSGMKTPGRTVKKKKRKSLLMAFVSPPRGGSGDDREESFEVDDGGMEGVVSNVAEKLGQGFRGIFGFGGQENK
jgi:myosin-5